MIQVQVNVDPDEPIEKALSRFKKNCTKAGIVKELKKRSYYEKPSEKKRRITLKRERKLKLASRDDQSGDNRYRRGNGNSNNRFNRNTGYNNRNTGYPGNSNTSRSNTSRSS
ncbi:MAG: 30S ribosomal protein S21 [Candidatus Poribacteria bacterium]|nr:30S ribosomal protein S21 [Candidatus Poribacteria bacterium]